jgi:predicted nuclease with RNAse H fold
MTEHGRVPEHSNLPEPADAAADRRTLRALAGSRARQVTLPSGRTLSADELATLAAADAPLISSDASHTRQVRRRFWVRRWARLLPLLVAMVGFPVAVSLSRCSMQVS